MQYSTNFNMNKPELNEQYRLSHWNDNTDIIDTEMQAIRSGTDDVMKETLLNFCYPIGSIYWSGVATNPHDLFGGTWVQIKDKFVWAKGDSDVLDATGGEKTHTLTTTEMPTHTHTFSGSEVTSGVNSRGHTHSVTAAGTVSSHSHGLNEHTHSVTAAGTVSVTTNPTFTGSEHSHTYTPAGSVTVKTNPTFSGSAVTSGGMSANATSVLYLRNRADSSGNKYDTVLSTTGGFTKAYEDLASNHDYTKWNYAYSGRQASKITLSLAHTHSVTAAGTISGGAYTFSGTQATLKATQGGSISGGAYKFTGSAVTSGKASGNTANAQPTFTGSAVTSGAESQNHTHKVTASGTNSNAGGGGAHNNMPPYVVKYCWQRTA